MGGRRRYGETTPVGVSFPISPEQVGRYGWPQLIADCRAPALAALAQLGTVRVDTLSAAIVTPSAVPSDEQDVTPTGWWLLRYVAHIKGEAVL